MLIEKSSSIGQLADNFNMSRPAIAKHIKILQNANLLDIEPDNEDGRQRNCFAQLEAIKRGGRLPYQIRRILEGKVQWLRNISL